VKRTTSRALLALAVFGPLAGCVDKTPPPLWPTPPPPTLAAPIGGWTERDVPVKPAAEKSDAPELPPRTADPVGPWTPRPRVP